MALVTSTVEIVMKQAIEQLIQAALARIVREDGLTMSAIPAISIERPRDSSHGDYSTNIAMILAKPFGMAPRLRWPGTTTLRAIPRLPARTWPSPPAFVLPARAWGCPLRTMSYSVAIAGIASGQRRGGIGGDTPSTVSVRLGLSRSKGKWNPFWSEPLICLLLQGACST